MNLVDQIRAIEKSLLGANCLSERMVEGIAKQARHVQREADRIWLEGQIRNHRKLMDMPKGLPPLKSSGGPSGTSTGVAQGAPGFSRHGASGGPGFGGVAMTRDLRPATADRVEISVRFENRPVWKPVSTNRAIFVLKATGKLWEVVVPEKQMRQAFEVMDDHNNWIGLVRGYLGTEIEGGFTIENPMIHVYLKPRSY